MTLTYRIHSFNPTRNARRRLISACKRISARETDDRADVFARINGDTMALTLDEVQCAYRNPDLQERKACIREASRTLKDIMLDARLTFTADLV